MNEEPDEDWNWTTKLDELLEELWDHAQDAAEGGPGAALAAGCKEDIRGLVQRAYATGYQDGQENAP